MILYRTRARSRSVPPAIVALAVCASLILAIRAWHSREVMVQQVLHYRDTGLSTPTPGSAIRALPTAVSEALSGLDSRGSVPELGIRIGTTGISTLLEDRARAMRDGVLSESRAVNAKLFFDGKQYGASVRLKGDLRDHWELPYRMSLRVALGSGQVLGSTDFSLHKPECRQHPYDQAFQSLMCQAGNLAAPHRFVRVQVNEWSWGVMDMEEHMSSAFLEKQARKDCLIIRFGDEVAWRYRATAQRPLDRYRLSDDRIYVRLFDAGKRLKDPLARMWLTYITESRERGRYVELSDGARYATCLAGAMLWGNAHTLAEENLRHYFNPYTLRLEPITTDQGQPLPWDAPGGLRKYSPVRDSNTFRGLWASSSFREAAQAAVDALLPTFSRAQESVDHYGSAFPRDERPRVDGIIAGNLEQLRAHDFAFLEDASPAALIGPGEALSQQDLEDLVDVALVRHYDDGTLSIHNLLPCPVTLTALVVDDSRIELYPVSVPPCDDHGSEPFKVSSSVVGIQDGRLSAEFEVQGMRFVSRVGPSLCSERPQNPLDADPEGVPPPFRRSEPGRWQVPSGNWVIEAPTCIPGDLIIAPGTRLEFKDEACLIVKGTLTAAGTAEAPIRLGPADRSWRGLFVTEALGVSELSHVDISSTSALESGMLRLTGGVSFYRADLRMSSCRFIGSGAEDGLNVIQSKLLMDHVTFTDMASDAVDLDFCTATIRDCLLKTVGGDALDFSGSTVHVSGTVVRAARDKGVSVGEASTAEVINCTFADVGCGVAAKDGSHAIVTHCTVTDPKIAAVLAYVKKPIFPPPELKVDGLETDAAVTALRQRGTLLTLDGNPVPESAVDVEALYRGPMRK